MLENLILNINSKTKYLLPKKVINSTYEFLKLTDFSN